MRQDDIDRLRAAEPDPRLDVTDKHFIKAFRGNSCFRVDDQCLADNIQQLSIYYD